MDLAENKIKLAWTTNNGFQIEQKWIGSQKLGTTLMDHGNGIAIDSSNNLYIVGDSQGGLDGNIDQMAIRQLVIIILI